MPLYTKTLDLCFVIGVNDIDFRMNPLKQLKTDILAFAAKTVEFDRQARADAKRIMRTFKTLNDEEAKSGIKAVELLTIKSESRLMRRVHALDDICAIREQQLLRKRKVSLACFLHV